MYNMQKMPMEIILELEYFTAIPCDNCLQNTCIRQLYKSIELKKLLCKVCKNSADIKALEKYISKNICK